MIRVGIVGISGYTGKEVFDWCQRHPKVCVTYVSAHTTTGRLDVIWPDLKGQTKLEVQTYDYKGAIDQCDVIFLALPHTQSLPLVGALLKAGKRVIDLSADFRLKSAVLYEKWYDVKHTDKASLRKAVYGLPELYRAKIKQSNLVANPGCYPTAAILGLAPLAGLYGETIQSVIVDAKSGFSGAGKKVAEALMVGNVVDNFKAYKVLHHRHTPEIEAYVNRLTDHKIKITFVPHLLPIARGIQETIYVTCGQKVNTSKLHRQYKKFYKTEPFVRILDQGDQPEIKNVVCTNFCDIGIAVSDDRKTVVITSVIDNLAKGAASQAVHNMNLMCGFEQTEGLL